MRVIKTVYLVLFISLFAFFAYQCGENKSEYETPKMNSNTETSTSGSATLQKGDAVSGKTLFGQTCAACHGMDAKGLPKLGKDLTTSTFVAEKSDADLLNFVKAGRLPSDPLNTTGVAMPPKGGNPALTDQQIMDIIAYVKTLHK